VCDPTNVTDVGSKLAGGCGPDPVDESGNPRRRSSEDGVGLRLIAPLLLPAVPVASLFGPLGGLGCKLRATCGSVAAAATMTAALAAALTVLTALRLRARRRTRSKVPGRGGSGSTSALSQTSIGSRWSVTMPHPQPP
jgi:hypothetical protein